MVMKVNRTVAMAVEGSYNCINTATVAQKKSGWEKIRSALRAIEPEAHFHSGILIA